MRKRMRLRKIKFKIPRWQKVLGCILLVYFSYTYFLSLMIQQSIVVNNQRYLEILVGEANHSNAHIYNPGTILDRLLKAASGIDVNNPVSIIRRAVNQRNQLNDMSMISFSSKDRDTEKPVNSAYVPDPNPVEIENPIVYIYNSHQLEQFRSRGTESYNVTPTVMMASFLLREQLNNMGMPTIVETNNITEFLRANAWNYAASYRASRYMMEEAFRKNETLRYFIDLHRDAIPRNRATTRIDGEYHARVLFVVGLEHPGYEANLRFVDKLNRRIAAKHPNLTRGIMKKQGPGVNGIYNQDFNDRTILIELGSYNSYIEEAYRTIMLIAPIINQVIREDMDAKEKQSSR